MINPINTFEVGIYCTSHLLGHKRAFEDLCSGYIQAYIRHRSSLWQQSLYVGCLLDDIYGDVDVSLYLCICIACSTHLNITWHVAPELVQESCVNTFMLAYSHSIIDFVTDFVVITIPLPFVSLLVSKIGHVLR